MLVKAGIKLPHVLTDNELRYILWRSYDNLPHPEGRRGILGDAEDVERQREIGARNFAAEWPMTSEQAAMNASEPMPVGYGDLGPIFNQFEGKPQQAISYLMKIGSCEDTAALHHPSVGNMDHECGKELTGHSVGYGLAKLVKYHPEVINNLQRILDDIHVVSRSENRVNLESSRYKAGIRLTWNNKKNNLAFASL